MTLLELKEMADIDRGLGEFGESMGTIEGLNVKCFSVKVGVNKPGRKSYSKYTFNIDGQFATNNTIQELIDSLIADKYGFIIDGEL